MWKATEKDKGYQRVAKTVEEKTEMEVIKTVSKAVITEYIDSGMNRMSVIRKGKTQIRTATFLTAGQHYIHFSPQMMDGDIEFQQ